MKRMFVALCSVIALAIPHANLLAQGKAMNAGGNVKTVTATSLTISAAAGKEMTFAIDATTKFVGKGLGTKASTGKMTATDAVGMGDRVEVAYHDMSGTLHAATVTVKSKAAGK